MPDNDLVIRNRMMVKIDDQNSLTIGMKCYGHPSYEKVHYMTRQTEAGKGNWFDLEGQLRLLTRAAERQGWTECAPGWWLCKSCNELYDIGEVDPALTEEADFIYRIIEQIYEIKRNVSGDKFPYEVALEGLCHRYNILTGKIIYGC